MTESFTHYRAKPRQAIGATDKDRLTYMLSLQASFVVPENMETEQGKRIAADVLAKFEGYKRWAEKQIQTLRG